MPYVNSVDTTTWGSRTVQAAPIDWIGLAENKALSVVSSVDGLLSQLSGSGSTALNSAVTAIAALGKFQPQSIKIDYAPLSYTSPTFIPAGGLNVPALASVPGALSIPSFAFPPVAPPALPLPAVYTATPVVISPVAPVNVSGSLPSPYTPKVTTPSAQPPVKTLNFSPGVIPAPKLITLTLPSLILPTPASRPTLNAIDLFPVITT